MTDILKVTKYRLNGQDYNSPNDIKLAIENQLGALIDKMSQKLTCPLTPKQKLELFPLLVENREFLNYLLNIDLEIEGDTWDTHYTKNILEV